MKKIFTIAIAALSIGNAFSQIPSLGLVGYFTFSGNANDLSSNANTGIVSGATLTTDRFGNANDAYFFNGSSAYIEIPHISAYNNQLYSISYWVKFNTSATSGSGGFDVNPALISKCAPSVTVTYDNWVFYEGNGTPGFVSNNSGGVGNASLFNDNNWHHITATVNSDSVRFYTDGIHSSSSLKGANLVFNSQPIRVGRSTATYWKAFNGIIDDLAIYNRALTANEVDSLYTASDPLTAGINETENVSISLVYPNPTSGLFTVVPTFDKNIAAIEIFNMVGQKVYSKLQPLVKGNSTMLDITNFENGAYILVIENNRSIIIKN